MADVNSQELRTYLKSLRKEKGLTLEQLEEKLGYSNSYLSQIETGRKKKPSFEFLMKAASFFNVSYEDLLNKAGYIGGIQVDAEKMLTSEKVANWNRDNAILLGIIMSNREFPLNGILDKDNPYPIKVNDPEEHKDYELSNEYKKDLLFIAQIIARERSTNEKEKRKLFKIFEKLILK